MAIRSLKTGLFTRSGMAGNSIIMPGSYESIATTTVGSGGASTITFSSIPSTYTHLQLRVLSQQNASLSDYGNIRVVANSDSGSNYSHHVLVGNGSSVSTSATTSTTRVNSGYSYLTSGSTFGVTVLDILDYANTNKYKTFRSLGGADFNGGGGVALLSGLWMSTSAISSLTITGANGNFTQYSHFALYGVN